jgi:hypothetical protein
VSLKQWFVCENRSWRNAEVKSLLATRRKGPVDEAHRRAELAPANDYPEASGGFDHGMHT